MTGSIIDTNAPKRERQFFLLTSYHPEQSTSLGFWIYLMSDCLIFVALFATHGVLGRSYAAGPSGKDVFDLPLVAINTTMLLLSSITYGFAMLQAEKDRMPSTILWLAVTGVCGAVFLSLELFEFSRLIAEGAGPQRSAFLSSFFALVGTHGLHVTVGVIWLITLIVQLCQRGLTEANRRRMMCLSMFWHFLDVIWIGVFSVVYLLGVLK